MKSSNPLITVIVIIFLISILSGITCPHPMTSPSFKHKIIYDAAISGMQHIGKAIETYKQNTGQFPNKLEDLLNCPTGLEDVWQGPYLKEGYLYDTWDRLYIYEPNRADPNRYVIISYGEDGLPGGDGYNKDIYNK